MADRLKKRIEIQKYEYLENEKSFLDEIKSIFSSFWRAIIWWKKKNLMKIADTSFKHLEMSPLYTFVNIGVSQDMECNTFFVIFALLRFN